MLQKASYLGLGLVLSFWSVIANAVDVQGVTDKEVVLGNHSMQSGPYALYGTVQRVMKGYFEKINEEGGVNGRKIKFIMMDSAANGQQASQAVKKLVEDDGVFAIVAGGGYVHQSVYKYLQQKGIPDVWIADPTDIYSDPISPTTFNYYPTYGNEAKYFGKYIVKHYAGKKLGILHVDLLPGKEALANMTKEIGDKLTIVHAEGFSPKEPNINSQILNLKRKGAEVVYLNAWSPLAALALKFAYQQDYHPVWLTSFSNCNKPTMDVVGADAMEGVISWAPMYHEENIEIPAVKQHLEFLKKYLPNEKPSALTMLGQAIGEITVETLKKAGKNLTRESFLKAAESIKDYKCSVCRLPNSSGPEKHDFYTNVQLMVAHGGKWSVLENQ